MNYTKPVSKSKWKFSLKSIDELQKTAEEYNTEIPVQEDVSILAEPVQAGGITIPNSLAVQPMEGCDGYEDGRPGPLTIRRYKRFSSGGAGLLWMEAIAVVPEGRANPRQLLINRDNLSEFKGLINLMREEAQKSMRHNPVIIAQLTHSGRYSKPYGFAEPLIMQRDPYRDPLIPEPVPTKNRKSHMPADYPLLTDGYLVKLEDSFTEAAGLAFEAGFDGVDIKSCHGYLVNEILASHTREGKYGGSFENRTRFLKNIINKIFDKYGKDKLITARLGIYDAIPFPYGWGVDRNNYKLPDLSEPKKLIKQMTEAGVKMLNISIGNPYYNPHFGRPFNQELRGGYEEPEHPVTGAARIISLTGEIQKEFPDLKVVGSGYSWFQALMGNVGAAVKSGGLASVIGGGRMAFAYPEFAKELINKKIMDSGKVCISCSGCTQMMRDGTTSGCVVRDEYVYLPIFEKARQTGIGWLQDRADECIQCQDPMCQHDCPTHIDIPGFIKQFAAGNIREGYEIIRKSNVLAEVCSRLCPVEELCEGTCIQKYIGSRPVAIAAIQRYLCEQGNKHGWARAGYPEKSSGRRVAVLGAGPAGIAAAVKLLEYGHSVTLYEKREVWGGTIESVTPQERQGNSLSDEVTALFKDIPGDRLRINLGYAVSKKNNLDKIIEQGFDACFIGMGLPVGTRMHKEYPEGLTEAMKFLYESKHRSDFNIKGKRIAVIGGGSTAMDALVTAKEHGAEDVYMLYRRSYNDMPACDSERDLALYLGIHFLFLTQPVEFISESGKLTGVKVCPTNLTKEDDSGRRRPVPVKESSYVIKIDIAVEALGQETETGIEEILPGIVFSRGKITVKPGSLETARKNVFAGGDIINGGATVVQAVADGMKAALEINNILK